MAAVKAIVGMDTNGNPDAEGVAGANVLCNNSVAHVNTIQNASLVLPQNTGASVQWTSRNYPVTGTRFSIGFWIRIDNPDMGDGGASQTIFTFSSDGGTSSDFEILHRSGLPGADNHGWNIVTAGGSTLSLVDNPIAADTWHWVTIDLTRHNTTGIVDLKVWNPWPTVSSWKTRITKSGFDFEGSGAVSDAVISFTGHQVTPAAGGMEFRIGGVYIMDGVTAEADTLSHREFLSLRPTVNTTDTPDCDQAGATAALDALATGTWDDCGDETNAQVTYAVGDGGGVKVEVWNLHSKVLAAGHRVGKWIYAAWRTKTGAGNFVYGIYNTASDNYDDAAAGTAALGSLSAKDGEVLLFDGDALFPTLAISDAIREIPWGGFHATVGTNTCREFSYLTMWQKNAPTEGLFDARLDHWTRGIGRGVCRGVAK